MFTFSVNREVDLSKLDCHPKTPLGREWLSQAYRMMYLNPGKEIKNIDAYAYGSMTKDNLKKKSTETELITEDELEAGFKGVCLEVYVSEEAQDAFLSYEERECYEQAIIEFEDMREYIFLEMQIDLAQTVLNASMSIKTAADKLAYLCDTYTGLRQLIADIAKEQFSWKSEIQRIAATPLCF